MMFPLKFFIKDTATSRSPLCVPILRLFIINSVRFPRLVVLLDVASQRWSSSCIVIAHAWQALRLLVLSADVHFRIVFVQRILCSTCPILAALMCYISFSSKHSRISDMISNSTQLLHSFIGNVLKAVSALLYIDPHTYRMGLVKVIVSCFLNVQQMVFVESPRTTPRT